MSVEKIKDQNSIRHLEQTIPLEYIYTTGVAGEKFFRELMENGKLMGTRCGKCKRVTLPGRIYCESCFEYVDEWIDVGNKGKVHSFTVTKLDVDGTVLSKPIIFAVIKFDGVLGGLIHKLDDVQPEKVYIGMPVEAVFREKAQRTGSINDIKYFKPV